MGNISVFLEVLAGPVKLCTELRKTLIQGTKSPSLHFAALLENVPHATREQMWVWHAGVPSHFGSEIV